MYVTRHVVMLVSPCSGCGMYMAKLSYREPSYRVLTVHGFIQEIIYTACLYSLRLVSQPSYCSLLHISVCTFVLCLVYCSTLFLQGADVFCAGVSRRIAYQGGTQDIFEVVLLAHSRVLALGISVPRAKSYSNLQYDSECWLQSARCAGQWDVTILTMQSVFLTK